MRRWLLLLSAGVLVTGVISCGRDGKDQKQLTIAVIPKGTTHIFWQSVHAGAIKAAKELGIHMSWIGPEKEDDRQQQIALVDNQVVNQVSGIVLAPLDDMALRRPVRSAVKNGIPVVIIDSGLKDSESIYTSFVATDNWQGGRIGGQQLGRLLGGQGKVIALRYAEGSASTENRVGGFLEAIKEFPGIEVASQEQYGGVTQSTAQQAAENLLIRFKDEQGQLTIDGIFCPNSSTTYGMHQALKRQRLAGAVKYVGFDAEDPLVEGIRQGEINGLVLQNPFNMGYLGVKTLVEHIQGRKVEKRIDTGVLFVGPDDLDKPEIQEMIKPDIEKWLSLQ
ncbi:MAG: substrate-binding domain-containing protein [Fidelibacterota bacterium]|nr:MAG: substrate-binding domain-containing protein [Candidatus Neomarinimicrobiota bacterium]